MDNLEKYVTKPGTLCEPHSRQPMLRAAVFLDRDGTLTEEVGYVNHIDRLKVFPWTGTAIRKLNRAGLMTIVVTNQSGVGQGYFPEDLVLQVHERMTEELAAGDAGLDALYYCPHHPTARLESYRQDCRCRKPGTGMIEQAVKELGIDVANSYMIGDSVRDVQLAANAGARSVLVMTGYGRGNYQYMRDHFPGEPDFTAENLLDAVEQILAYRDGGNEAKLLAPHEQVSY
jgi:D-glycero-D-manno-heptose 1,7-bisphosphate phosphatase